MNSGQGIVENIVWETCKNQEILLFKSSMNPVGCTVNAWGAVTQNLQTVKTNAPKEHIIKYLNSVFNREYI